jgi:site-specific DNA recombinase
VAPGPFGYQADGMTVVETEAELIRQAAQRLLARETVKTILRDWLAQDVTTPQRNRWVALSFRRMLTPGFRSL